MQQYTQAHLQLYPNDTEKQNLIQLLLSQDLSNVELGLRLEVSTGLDLEDFWIDVAAVTYIKYRVFYNYTSYPSITEQNIEYSISNKKNLLHSFSQKTIRKAFEGHLFLYKMGDYLRFLPIRIPAYKKFSKQFDQPHFCLRPQNPFFADYPFVCLHLCEIKQLPDLSFLSAFRGLKEFKITGLAPNNTLPEGLKNLPEDIQGLDLSGLSLKTLPDWLQRFKLLKSINLSENPLAEIPDFLLDLPHLEHLNLKNTALIAIPDKIYHLRKLKTLDISNNKITEISIKIDYLKALKRLFLFGNPITDWQKAFKTFRRLPNLRAVSWFDEKPIHVCRICNCSKLKISGRKNMTEEAWKMLFEVLPLFSKFKQFIIKNCDLKELPEEITPLLNNVQWLDLSKNKLQKLPQGFDKIKRLERLDLSENNLTVFPDFILQNKQVLELLLSHNPISEIPNSIKEMNQLHTLKLNNMHLSQLPETLTEMPNLYHIYLQGNKFKKFPAVLFSTKPHRLYLLDLSNNKITEIPDEINKLESLMHLYLEGNNLKSLPETIIHIKYLAHLKINKNPNMDWAQAFDVMSRMPYANLTVICFNDFSMNWGVYRKDKTIQFYQTKSADVWKENIKALSILTDLEKLILFYGNFNEPFDFSAFKQLKHIQIAASGNLHYWQEPEGSLQNLETLSMAGCKLSQLPAFIPKLPFLHQLILENNNFKEFPSELLAVRHPLTVNIRYNNIDKSTIPLQHPFLTIQM